MKPNDFYNDVFIPVIRKNWPENLVALFRKYQAHEQLEESDWQNDFIEAAAKAAFANRWPETAEWWSTDEWRQLLYDIHKNDFVKDHGEINLASSEYVEVQREIGRRKKS